MGRELTGDPSFEVDGEVRGGVILLGLRPLGDGGDGELTLRASYTDRAGQRHSTQAIARFSDDGAERYDHAGVQKAVLLTRYVRTLKGWLSDSGGLSGPEAETGRGRWERTSTELEVSPAWRERLEVLRGYVAAEAESVGDPALRREVELLEGLVE